MKAVQKNEWFKLDKPIGEPNVAENYREDCYYIERLQKENGEVVWFGQGTNWVSKDQGKTWSYLSSGDGDNGTKNGGVNGGDGEVWIECDAPIYEKLYLEL